LRRRLTPADLMAAALTGCFVAFGLLTLAGASERHFDRSRYLAIPLAMQGSDRVWFGIALLAVGYLLMRWIFPMFQPPRVWSTELKCVAALSLAGYLAYQYGNAS